MSVWSDTALTRLVGVRYPVVQAPMGGGGSTPELVAAVSEAGALGSLGLAYTPPDVMREAIAAVRARTDRPFAGNLFLLGPPPEADLVGPAALLEPLRRELGLGPAEPPRRPPFTLEDSLAVVLDERPPVFSFTFGAPSEALVRDLKERGIVVAGTATTVREAEELERRGVDAVVAQGWEAGGHRGTFVDGFEGAFVGTVALVPQVADRVRVPVVAAGGIMDGRGVAAAVALGAAGVQMGTAFLTCPESGISEAHRRALLEGNEESTVVTSAFTGRPARGIYNRLVRELGPHSDELAPFPIQAALAMDIRDEATKRGNRDWMTILAGQGLRLSRTLPAAELVAALAAETEQAVRRLSST